MPRTGLNLCFGKSLGLEGSGRPGEQTKGQGLTQAHCLQRDPGYQSGQPITPKGPFEGPDPEPGDLGPFQE